MRLIKEKVPSSDPSSIDPLHHHSYTRIRNHLRSLPTPVRRQNVESDELNNQKSLIQNQFWPYSRRGTQQRSRISPGAALVQERVDVSDGLDHGERDVGGRQRENVRPPRGHIKETPFDQVERVWEPRDHGWKRDLSEPQGY